MPCTCTCMQNTAEHSEQGQVRGLAGPASDELETLQGICCPEPFAVSQVSVDLCL